ncbi:hypothetical protein [Diaphorobacter caeni]|uniref:hypothetical protein n=1 Tax=Diaphorobacter caeni TaxID=2784387 RepID=UPI00188E8F26|nr:hypothetical protein [Diaphorobacter caeni]MBF5006390.1 hypothetical protein [Diaphorobacter caeni]
MVFEVTLSNVLWVVGMVIAAIWALMKVISLQQEKHINARFDALATTIADIAVTQSKNAEATLNLEREFHAFQIETTRDFVRRDDFVRHVGIIEARIDNYALRMERVLEQLLKGGTT